MVKKALLIGINYYATPKTRLRGCIDDVINVKNLLMDAYAFDLSNILILRDDLRDPSILPTKNNILKALTTLVENDTECWFHYSGHGDLIQEKTHAIIVPSDFRVAGFILDNDLYDIFKKAKCRCFLLFDSCNSGNIVELPWTFQNNPIIKTNVNNHILVNTEIYMFSGCKVNQNSVDIYSIEEAEYVGVFTEAFLICLRRRKHETDLLTLYSDICAYLAEKHYEQVPVFSSSIENPEYKLIREECSISLLK